ncbi:MAG: SH3 domain-containing protein [Treponema sp.]|nr:SH3 domain-containing protein [Treponema sp.]
MRPIKHYSFLLFVFLVLFASCQKKVIGWGVLLWAIGDPAIPSGTVLPVQVRSNIEQAWITGIPDAYKTGDRDLVMVPLPHLEFFSSKGGAERFASAFAEYAVSYAETIQDGLPIRDKPENSAKRTYRLKEGEIIKILAKTEGVAAVSTTGVPLEGNWFKVLTHGGSTGYCFSYRLRIFEHTTGPLGDAPVQADTSDDRELELVLSRTWYPESYGKMISSGRLDLDALSRNHYFTAGIATGRAIIHLEKDAVFLYRKINKTGNRSWNFDGTTLNVRLQSESALEIEWENDNKAKQTAVFVTLPASVENIVSQEKERRQNKIQALYNQGPRYVSANYGTFSVTAAGNFNWDEINSLPEEILSDTVLGNGSIDMDYGLSGEMAERYTGALALRPNTVSGSRTALVFAYTLDNQGLRMEYIPSIYAPDRSINRRSSSPFVIYFSPAN